MNNFYTLNNKGKLHINGSLRNERVENHDLINNIAQSVSDVVTGFTCTAGPPSHNFYRNLKFVEHDSNISGISGFKKVFISMFHFAVTKRLDIVASYIYTCIHCDNIKSRLTLTYLYISSNVTDFALQVIVHQYNALLAEAYRNAPSGSDFCEFEFIPTSGFKNADLTTVFNNIEALLESPDKLINSLVGHHFKKIFVSLIYAEVVPARCMDLGKFLGAYDYEFMDSLQNGLNVNNIVDVLKSVLHISRTVLLDHYVPEHVKNPEDFITLVIWLHDNRYKQVNSSSLARFPGHVSKEFWVSECIRARKSVLMLDFKYASISVKSLINYHIRLLDNMYDLFVNVVNESRDPPFVIGIHGESQSGKTSFVAKVLSQVIQRELGISCDDINSGFKILNGADQYLSSYQQNSDHVVLFDEIGAYKNCERQTQNVIQNSFLEMLSGGTFVLNSADLESKGKREFKPKGIIIASNMADFGFDKIVNHLDAVWNRFDMVIVIYIKREFALLNENGDPIGGIDVNKLKEFRQQFREEYSLTNPGENPERDSRWYPQEFGLRKKEKSGFGNVGNRFGLIELIEHVKDLMKVHREKLLDFNDINKTTFYDPTSGFEEDFDFGVHSESQSSLPLIVEVLILYFNMFLLGFFKFLYLFFPSYEFVTKRVIKYQIKVRFVSNCRKAMMKMKAQSQDSLNAFRNIVASDVYFSEIRKYILPLGILTGLIIIFKKISKTKNKTISPKSVSAEQDNIYCSTAGNFVSRENKEALDLSGRIPSRYIGEDNDIWNLANKNNPQYGKACCTPIEIIKQYCKRNTFLVEANYNGKVASCQILNIDSDYYIAPMHFGDFAKNEKCVIRVYQIIYCQEDSSIYKKAHMIVELSSNAFDLIPMKNDLCLLRITQLSAGKSLKKFLIKDFGDIKYFEAYNVFINRDNDFIQDKCVGKFQNVSYSKHILPIEGESVSYKAIVTNSEYPSFIGRCGTALVSSFSKQACIVGINCFGKPGENINGFSPFTLSDFENAVKRHKSSILSPTSSVILEESFTFKNLNYKVQPIDRTDDLYWLEESEIGGLRSLGKANIPVVRPNSRVFQLPTYSSYFKHFPSEYHHKLVKPNFRSYIDSDGTYKSVFKNAFLQMADQAHEINVKHLETVVVFLTEKFSTVINNIEFWDKAHACSGASYNPFCRPVPKTTGAGWPLNGKKIEHMVQSTSKYAPDGFVPNPELANRIDETIQLMKEGTRPMTVYKACVKDEPRDKEKVRQRSIRVFTCAPMDSIIIQKMFIGSFSGLYTKNFLTTETVGGINCYSKDWKAVRDKLHKFKNCINGDFSKYDKKASPLMLMAAYSIIYNIISKEYNGDILELENIFRVLGTEVSNPIILFNRNFIGVNGSLSSGIYTTFLCNDICNSIYIRLAWLDITKESLEEFEENVVFFSMGDDNTFTVSDKYISVFNFRSIHLFFKKVGIKYTNAEKTDDIYGSVDVCNATICKRKFVYDDKLDYVLCPIEKASIGKMLTMAIREGPLTDHQKVCASLTSSFYEFFQYGEDEYNKCISRCKLMMLDSGISFHKYPTYQEMKCRIVDQHENPWSSDIYPDLRIDQLSPTQSLSCDDCANQRLVSIT